MKKETLITAIVFLGAGFLAGYAFNAHRNSRQKAVVQSLAADSSPQSSQGAATAPPSGSAGAASSDDSEIGTQLPKGHPPVNNAEVIQFFKDASAKNPLDPAPRLKLADFLYDQRQFTEAIPWFEKALALDPKNVDARTDMATCLFNLGRSKEAVDQLHAALKIDPRHEPTLFNLIIVNLEGTHNLRAANDALSRLQSINPGYPGLDQLEQAISSAGAPPASPVPAATP